MSNKAINLHFICYSLACFAVLAVGVYFLQDWQVHREAGIFLVKAQAAETEGDLAKAIDLYGKYLRLDPKNIDARAQYGSLLAHAGAYAGASQAFEAVLRRDPTKSDIRRKAVKADMAIGRVPDARDHLENYLLKESPDDPELLELEGACQARAGEYAAAGRSLATAIQRDPTRIAAYVQLIALLSRPHEDLDKDREDWLKPLPAELQKTLRVDKAPEQQKTPKEDKPPEQQTALKVDNDWAEKTADYWTDRLVKANPQEPQAYLVRGYRRLYKNLFDLTLQDAEAALKLKPDHPEALYLAALACLKAKQLDKCREYATRGVKAAPKDSRMYEILAEADWSKQPEEALKWLQMGVDADGPPRLWLKLGDLQIIQHKFDEAKQTAQGLRKKNFPKVESQSSPAQVEPGVYADLLEAQIQQAQGHWLKATRGFGQIAEGLKSDPDLAKQAFYSLGQSYEQLADFERALSAYRQAVDADPMWIPAREAVAACLQSLGRSEEALEEQSTLARLKGAPLSAWVNLIHWSISRTARLSADKRNWSDVDDLVNQAAKSAPQSPTVPLLRAELLMAQGRAAEAEQLFEKAKDKYPAEIAFWLALIDLAIRDNRWDRALHTLDEAEKKFGDRVVLRLYRGQYLVRKGEKDAAEQLRKLAEKSKDFSAQDQVQLWRELASFSLAVDDFPQAERLGRLVMAELPSDLGVRLRLLDMAVQAKDVKLMDAALDEIRHVESGGPIWHYATALRLFYSDPEKPAVPAAEPAGQPKKSSSADEQRQAVLHQAQYHVAEALRLRPNWSRALMLEGKICEELHQEDSALARYLEAIQQGESSTEVARRALRLLSAKGQYAAANNLLRQFESRKVPFTTDLFREQSRVLGGLQDYAGALKAAQQAAVTSKNAGDYLWLGQLHSILGQRDEAEKALQQANRLDDRAPDTWVALVQFFVRTGQKDRAEKALADGRKKISAAEAPLALAECLEILGKTDEAGQQYALALKQKPDDPNLVRSAAIYYVRRGDLPKAADELVRIVNGQLHATPQQVADARGALARVRADQGGYQNLLEAIRLVEENLAAAPSSADNLRLKARLLALHPQLAQRREALAIYEKLVEDPKNAAADDRFRLAQLYLAMGDWAKGREQMLALLAAGGNQPQYMAGYARALLGHKETSEAQPWIDRLEQIAPDEPQAAQLRAEVQFRAGKIDEALATLAKFVEKAPAGSADRLARTLAAAAQLEDMASRPGDTVSASAVTTAKEKAEELYRQYAKEDPKQGLVLVGFLGRQKRFEEALQLAEEEWKAAESPQIAASFELLLRQPGITPAEINRLADLLATALKKHDHAVPLRMAMAELKEKQEKYPDAETLYREILKSDERNVAALNNLADLLGLSGRQLDEAKHLIEKAIAIAGAQPALLDTRASVYLALGQAEKAVTDMQEVLEQQPAPNRYFHLALAQQKLGHSAEAADALKKARAMQIRPESLPSLERPAYAELLRALQ